MQSEKSKEDTLAVIAIERIRDNMETHSIMIMSSEDRLEAIDKILLSYYTLKGEGK